MWGYLVCRTSPPSPRTNIFCTIFPNNLPLLWWISVSQWLAQQENYQTTQQCNSWAGAIGTSSRGKSGFLSKEISAGDGVARECFSDCKETCCNIFSLLCSRLQYFSNTLVSQICKYIKTGIYFNRLYKCTFTSLYINFF